MIVTTAHERPRPSPYSFDSRSTRKSGAPGAPALRHLSHDFGVNVQARVRRALERAFGLPVAATTPRVRRALGFEALEGRLVKTATLMMVTDSDVAGGGSSGTQSWDAAEIMSFGGSGFTLDPGTTAGSFSRLMDMRDFGGNPVIDALELVQEDITIAGVTLARGSILFSTAQDETIDGQVFDKTDLIVFTPATEGDYSSGTFSLLIDGTDLNISGNLAAIALVTENTTVGDVNLTAGTFLISAWGGNMLAGYGGSSQGKDVIAFTATSLGSTTSGARSMLIDGQDIGLSGHVTGIHLVQSSMTLGDTSLSAGQLILSLSAGGSSVGDNEISVTSQDMFVLDVTDAGNNTDATATLLFDGSEVNLGSANLGDFTIQGDGGGGAPNNAPTTSGLADVSVSEDAPPTDIDLHADFADVEDADSALAYTVVGNTNPALFSGVTVNPATGTLTLSYAGNAYGVAHVTVRATDSQGAWVESTFDVTVAAVNDTPTTSGLADVSVSEDAPPTEVDLHAAFADVEDADSALTYNVVGNTNPALFSGVTVNPATGKLTLSYAPDESGLAELTIRATDTNGEWAESVLAVEVEAEFGAPASPPGDSVPPPSDQPPHAGPQDPPPPGGIVLPVGIDLPVQVAEPGNLPSASSGPSGGEPNGPSADAPPLWTGTDTGLLDGGGGQSGSAGELEERLVMLIVPDMAKEIEAESEQQGDTLVKRGRGWSAETLDPQEKATGIEAPPGTPIEAALSDWDGAEESLDPLFADLDDLARQMSGDEKMGTSQWLLAGVGTTLTAGTVVWSGSRTLLTAAFATGAPYWQQFDPLQVLEGPKRKRRWFRWAGRNEAEETLETLVE